MMKTPTRAATKATVNFAISGPCRAFIVVVTQAPPASSMRRGVAVVIATLHKSSFRNEGTRSLTANAVGIRRQAERGADGRRAVDRVRRAVGAGRAAVAGEGAALPLSRPEATAGPGGAAGDLVRVAHGDLVDAPAGRAWFRLRGDLLAAARRVAEGRRVGAAAPAATRPLTRGR